jgi:selenocysteine lyase/cysteine desulfurase
MNNLEKYFEPFRNGTIGRNVTFTSPFGEKKVIYSDWTASGRLFEPIERNLIEKFGPYVGNTHTETSVTGSTMTIAFHQALKMIKDHVNADQDDVIIASGSGMTGVVSKFQRILGFKAHENHRDILMPKGNDRPVVFITHMEHHSNHTTWLESLVDVVIIRPCKTDQCDIEHLKELLLEYKDRKVKIASVSACSNVTGIRNPYHDVAKLMHQNGGLCFVDFACSAPYVDINMHPADDEERLDAVFFSPHKFLGGPGTPGILVFDRALYKNSVPDNPGGGTVNWTNPWGEKSYIADIEIRESGGTPPFLQTIKAAMAVKLKEEMGVENILAREEELLERIFARLCSIPNLKILSKDHKNRLGVISFYIDDLHFNLAVRMLNDRYGIQMRGGCSCAGTYGHLLLDIPRKLSKMITDKVDSGDLAIKPGWVRFSIHPSMTNDEVDFIVDALAEIAANHLEWAKDYTYDPATNEFYYSAGEDPHVDPLPWFELNLKTEEVKS